MDVFQEEIKRKLMSLSYRKQLLFALLICDKLYPNYLYFMKRCNWGEPKILLEAVEMMYQSLFKRNLFSETKIESHIEAVDSVMPDTEDFLDNSVSIALDACTAVYSSLCFMLDHNTDHVIDVATYARDTVYLSIVNRDELDMNLKGMDSQVMNDPLMVGEVTRQVFVIDELKKIEDKDINDELIQHLKLGAAIINLDTLK